MTEPRQLAVVRSLAELHAAVRARTEELGISRQVLDDLAGLQPGYSGKVLAPRPMRLMGRMSFGAILGALGLALIVIVDEEQLRKVQGRHEPRMRHMVRKLYVLRKNGKHCNKPNFVKLSFLRQIASKAGKARLIKISPKRRRQIARQAARKRWSPTVTEIPKTRRKPARAF